MTRFGLFVAAFVLNFTTGACSSSSKPQQRAPIDPCLKSGADSKAGASDRNSTKTTKKKNNSRYNLVSSEVTWEDDIKPLIDRHCISCHNKGKTPPELNEMPASRRLNADIVEAVAGRKPSMPTTGSISKTKQKLFLSWEDDGFLEEASRSSSSVRTSTKKSNSRNDDPYDNQSNRSNSQRSTTQDDRVTKNPC